VPNLPPLRKPGRILNKNVVNFSENSYFVLADRGVISAEHRDRSVGKNRLERSFTGELLRAQVWRAYINFARRHEACVSANGNQGRGNPVVMRHRNHDEFAYLSRGGRKGSSRRKVTRQN